MTAAPPQRPFSEVVLDVAFPPLAAAPQLPVDALSRAQKAAELEQLQKRRAMEAAREAELTLALADDAPDRFAPRRMRPTPSGLVGRRRASCPVSRSSSSASWR